MHVARFARDGGARHRARPRPPSTRSAREEALACVFPKRLYSRATTTRMEAGACAGSHAHAMSRTFFTAAAMRPSRPVYPRYRRSSSVGAGVSFRDSRRTREESFGSVLGFAAGGGGGGVTGAAAAGEHARTDGAANACCVLRSPHSDMALRVRVGLAVDDSSLLSSIVRWWNITMTH